MLSNCGREQGVRNLCTKIGVRLEWRFLRLDAYTAQVQAAQPYLRLSRADVLRMLLDKGLSAASGRAQATTAD